MPKTTLGSFISENMRRQQINNSNLAEIAGISEGAVRNLLKHGSDPKAKDPDARTLRYVADALNINPLRLYRLAGYLPAKPDTRSVRADFVADVFDHLPQEKQEAVLGVIDAMASDATVTRIVQSIRSDAKNPLAGFDLQSPYLIRVMANILIAEHKMTEEVDLKRITSNSQILQYKWSDLPQSTQERIKALIQYKLSLDYDPTMVDPEWRE
jgi:hypothetical protein